MGENLSYSSLCLSRFLDRHPAIGTEEQVNFRRKIQSMTYYLKNVQDYVTILFSGSKGEGLNFPSSDTDLMIVDKYTQVMNSFSDRVDNRQIAFVMSRENCNPGFVLLELKHQEKVPSGMKNHLVTYGNKIVLSSLLHRDGTMEIMRVKHRFECEGHGPCATNTEMDYDFAFCFKCKMWPTEASEFITRRRCHDWPNRKLLKQIIDRGCHVVAIGDKDSDISHLQWRLSFSAAEKDLIHSFSHIQFKVYALLKILLKQAINKEQGVDGMMCSYFLKTALFYTIEETGNEFWREENMIRCYLHCFSLLVKWVEQGYCPNFFVKDNNMFRNKIHGVQQRNLLRVLHNYHRTGWTVLYRCNEFQTLESYVTGSLSIRTLDLNETEREVEVDKLILSSISPVIYELTMDNGPAALVRSFHLLHRAERKHVDICVLMVRRVLGDWSLCCLNNLATRRHALSNKHNYTVLRNCETWLREFSRFDMTSGPLTLATFYYKEHRYEKTIHICQKVLMSCQKCLVFWNGENTMFRGDIYKHDVCGRGLSICHKARNFLSRSITLSATYKDCYPTELLHDIEADTQRTLDMPPIPYALFLTFLCYSRLGDVEKSRIASRDLKEFADRHKGQRGDHLVINLQAICQYKLGNISDAVDLCLLSQRLRPTGNGANSILSGILET